MAKEPGNLSDFEAPSQEERDAWIDGYLTPNRSPHLRAQSDERTVDAVGVEWTAYEARIRNCLQSSPKADRLLDWSTVQGDVGRLRLLPDPCHRLAALRDQDQERREAHPRIDQAMAALRDDCREYCVPGMGGCPARHTVCRVTPLLVGDRSIVVLIATTMLGLVAPLFLNLLSE